VSNVHKKTKPHYSIKKYLLVTVVAATIGFFVAVAVYSLFGSLLGFGCTSILRLTMLFFPFLIFCVLYGFYKGLVKYYGFKSDKNLFFGGRF